MTDRAQTALKATGMDEAPVASLERDDALFVLTARTLLFQDSGGTRRVTLRDLTRIHSDQEGTLRVETPAGTALTASLLGFDAARVQAFFAQVRDTTARAKQEATSPLPTGAEKTFGTPSAPSSSAAPAQATSASQPSASQPPATPAGASAVAGVPVATSSVSVPARPAPIPEPTRAVPTIVIGDSSEEAGAEEARVEEAGADAPASRPVARTITAPPSLTKSAPTPASASAPVAPAPVSAAAQSSAPVSPPVVISSSGFSPSNTRPPAAPAPVAVTPVTLPTTAPVAAPATRSQPPTPASAAPSSLPVAIKTLPTRTSSPSLAGLSAQADTVEALVSRLRILGVVLGVAAIALAFFLFKADQPLTGLWTLIAGGVGAIALLAVADLARLLVAIARATGAGGPDDNQ
ncbi:MAG: hypothetical protein JWQ08_984 [Deinococcus sp.]|nr:hypothetical protein [Deinococcus sp.]